MIERTLLDMAPPAPRPTTAGPLAITRLGTGASRRARTSHGTRPYTAISSGNAAANRLRNIRSAMQGGASKLAWQETQSRTKTASQDHEQVVMLWNGRLIPGRFGRAQKAGTRPRVLTPFSYGAVNSALLIQSVICQTPLAALRPQLPGDSNHGLDGKSYGVLLLITKDMACGCVLC